MKLTRVLETVERLRPAGPDGKRETDGRYDREVLRVLLDSGMIRAEDEESLRDVLDTGELDLLGRNTGRRGGKRVKKQKKLRPAFVALLFSAALFLVVIGMVLGLFLSRAAVQPQPSETAGTEQSGEPAPRPSHSEDAELTPAPSESEKQVVPSQQVRTSPSQQMNASPSPSQSGGTVTPRQPEPSGSSGEVLYSRSNPIRRTAP